ncbi:hypothetical protein I7I50_06999 [Histoplasma capsulatum G186AR]|uniref:Uncharacterized protein n=1 Tax=Ajellomyces capsulatus TaxID=5037 RepID=A0A8H7Z1U1_AJECA|nr:hypothetical protein I7I52_09927 [Histoplasma capsulatum]QSS67811.1 hypothetical protein I7I50_06999 [Histoplasma capsulatum G186AR]
MSPSGGSSGCEVCFLTRTPEQVSVNADGYVTVFTRSVKVRYNALKRLMPVNPAVPAFRMTASSFGSEARNRRDKARTDSKLARSTFSGLSVTRFLDVAYLAADLLRCAWRRERVSALFLALRVVKRSVRHLDSGRVVRNSSIVRQQMENPRPL